MCVNVRYLLLVAVHTYLAHSNKDPVYYLYLGSNRLLNIPVKTHGSSRQKTDFQVKLRLKLVSYKSKIEVSVESFGRLL